MNFTLDSIKLYPYSIPLATPFRISAGTIFNKDGLLLEVRSGDFTGWGEASVDLVPFYAHETVGSAADVISKALWPLLANRTFSHPDEVSAAMEHFRGNNFAKAAIDAAVWDIYGKMADKPVWQLLGGTHREFESGPSIGIKDSPEKTVATVEKMLDAGDARIKIKVCPVADTPFIEAVRNAFPDIRLMVDANNAYSLSDAGKIALWDRFDLLMIEQPLDESDIYFHSILRKKIKNPVCLDESIHTLNDALCCAELQAADIVNIKVCRVGGLSAARKIHDICQQNNISNWIGGRVGSGVAVAARIAAATLPNCTLPSDCVLDSMYMSDDLLQEPFTHDHYKINAPVKSGLGFEIDRGKLEHYKV